VIFIWYLYGIEHALKYVTVIVAALMLSTYLKRRIKRQRPKMRDDMMLKPMIIRKRENNHSMPSGDSIQAGVFLYAYLHRFDEAIDNHLSRFIVCLLMINVLLGRVYFCCHYFSDTVVGFIIGVIVSFMAFNYLYV
jgi:membrane-associated phospholipid phosphatase